MINKIFEERLKGLLYTQEPWRLIAVDSYRAVLYGHDSNHVLVFVDGEWNCSCTAWQTQFMGRGTAWCRHTIALAWILAAMHVGAVVVRQAEFLR